MSAALSRVPELVHVAAPAAPVAVSGVVLVLPGGSVKSVGRYRSMPEWGLRPLLQRVALVGADHGVAVCLLRYRVRGWNGEAADPLADTRWALEQLDTRHGGVPCVLVGNSLGGRAAFRAAGAPRVVGVAGIAPWLPEGEPVDQLAGREALILHGDRDRSEAGAEKSLEFASRARAVAPGLARLEIPGAGHFLLKGAKDAFELCTHFTMSVLAGTERGTVLETARGGNLRTVLPIPYQAGIAAPEATQV